MEYTSELGEKVCELVEQGDHTLKQICAKAGITRAEYLDFKKNIPEFKQMLREAEDQRYENRLAMATRAQKKLIVGFQTKDVTEEFDKDGILLSRKIVSKLIAPSPSVVLNALKALDLRYNTPERFDHTSGGQPIKQLPNIFINIPATAKSLKTVGNGN